MDNLITILSRLSEELLQNNGENKPWSQRDASQSVKQVRQKAFDVIHQYRQDASQENLYWYPEILVTDYAYELLQRGAEASSNLLFTSIGELKDSEHDFDDILTFLLNLKGPFLENVSDRQHPFSLSGSDYFFNVAAGPFRILPKELTCGVIDGQKTPVPIPPKTMLLDNFIETPKRYGVVRCLPHLQDLVEAELSKPTIKPRKPEEKQLEHSTPRPISPWSDFERDILDGAEFTNEDETEPKKSFLEDYATKLNAPRQNPFERVKKPQKYDKRKGLALSIYLQEEHLKSLIEPSMNKQEYHEIDLQDFINQVKYLLLGIDGHIFKFDATEKKYFMKCGIHVDGLPPDCLFDISKPFLECGTYLKKLSVAVEDGFTSNLGVLYSTFWSSVSMFLIDHNKSVAGLPSQNCLMLLKMSTSKMCSDLAAVYRLCFPKKGALPSDGHLMSYLFDYGAFMQNPSAVFNLIYDCCVVYFSKLLEKWIFHGSLNDTCVGDFFICINKELDLSRDRSLYCSVTITEEIVPSCLHNLALKIFSCGKAIWLLKMCDPESNLVIYTETRKQPKLKLCFTDKDFSDMEIEFKNYEEAVFEMSGKLVTFTTLRETEEQEMRKILQSSKKSRVEGPHVVDESDTKVAEIIETEKKTATEYYEKLTRDAENVKNLANWKTKRLELHDKRVAYLKQDLINKNDVLDEEGNVIEPSEADVANANIVLEKNKSNSPLKEKTDNEAMQNKSKILGTTLFTDDVENNPEAMINKMKIMDTGTETEQMPQNNQPFLTEAMRNKMKIMGSENETEEKRLKTEQTESANNLNRTVAMRNKLKILGSSYENSETAAKNILQQPLTEAMKNKKRNLGTEIGAEEISKPRPSKPMTEALRNKLKILGSDFGKDPTFYEKTTGELTEAQKNKRKMLGTDIDLSLLDKLPEPRARKKIEISECVAKETVPDLEIIKHNGNCFETAQSVLPNLLEMSDDSPRPVFDNMDMTTFTRSIQRSLLIALNAQERLANSSVLKHFLQKENFMSHLTSLRCFYLLNDGEFSRSLTYGLFQSLVQSTEPQQFFDPASLNGILNEALNSAHHGSQTNVQNVSFQISDIPKKLDKMSHNVLSPFQLSYKVNWPMNILITGQILKRYRRVFHVLVNLKRVHWMLNETFLLLKSQTKDHVLDGKLLMKSPEYTKLSTYRHAMTLFIMTLEEHLSTNGLQEAWNNFMKQLETVNDLDLLYHKHVEFVKDVCRRCFLSRSCLLLSYINELVELGLSFHHVLKSSTWRLINEQQYSHPKFPELKVVFRKFCKATKVFTKALRKKSQNEELAIHTPLLELINLKIKF